jgi:hypothetical protein
MDSFLRRAQRYDIQALQGGMPGLLYRVLTATSDQRVTLGLEVPMIVRCPTSEAAATKFLRTALAGDALGVSELEAKARAKGLLREDQSITHLKAFKRAKRSLGVTSVRTGFGARSQWLWQMPQQNEAPSTPARPAPPVRRIPVEWLEGIAHLDPDRPPSDVPRHRWSQFVADCDRFLSSSGNWPERAYQLGWDATTLFGCAPKRPLDYSGSAGLLWAMNGGTLVKLHRDWAVIDAPIHRRQRVFYRRNVDAAKITLPWLK